MDIVEYKNTKTAKIFSNKHSNIFAWSKKAKIKWKQYQFISLVIVFFLDEMTHEQILLQCALNSSEESLKWKNTRGQHTGYKNHHRNLRITWK
jgi:hypothetical protein